jgi:hypothetical protein
MTAYRRKPMPLRQLDEYSCYTNVIAQIRWMFGTSGLRGAAAVREVDRLTGRRPGRPSGMQSQLLLLAREGYRITEFSGPEVDLTRLRAEGVTYMRELIGPDWEPGCEDFWTPERVARYARSVAVYHSRFAREFTPYLGQVTLARLRPRERYAARLIDAGCVIAALLDNGDAGSSHAALLYGRDSQGFLGYVPDIGGGGLMHLAAGGIPLVSTMAAVTLPAVAIPAVRAA